MRGNRSERGRTKLARRLRRLPEEEVLGAVVRVADRPSARLLGLAGLRAEQAGAGLLIPGCRSVHTLWMRFDLDIVFLDEGGALLTMLRGVGPRRIVFERRAAAVLELPHGRVRDPDLRRSGESQPDGGEISAPDA
jgi:uncharacterized membrane protein (UPF0127 family)